MALEGAASVLRAAYILTVAAALGSGISVMALLSALVSITILCCLHFSHPSRKVYLLDFYCFVRPAEYIRKHTTLMQAFKDAKYYPEKVHNWFEKLLAASGLAPESVVPNCVLDQIASGEANMKHEVIQHETEWVCCDIVRSLLEKTRTAPSEIGIVITTLSCFTPTPSLAAMIINSFGLSVDVRAYSLGGMGCSASVIGVDLAKSLLKAHPNTLVLLVCHENISSNTYTGVDPSMLLTNAIFRMGGAAILLSNRSKDRRRAKYELKYSRCSHFAASDSAYGCMGIQEDQEGRKGVYIKKDVVKVAEVAMAKHVRMVAPYILPLRFLVKCLVSKTYAAAPEFGKAFDHILMHCGGKAIIDSLEKGLKLRPEMTQPTRDALYRFGNTSSASTWYVLSAIESGNGLKRGDRIWHLSFGGGFKVNTAVWKAKKTIHEMHSCWE